MVCTYIWTKSIKMKLMLRYFILFLLLTTVVECKKKSKSKSKFKKPNIGKIKDSAAMIEMLQNAKDGGALGDVDMDTFNIMMQNVKDGYDVFSVKTTEIEGLKAKYEKEIEGMQKLHEEMSQTQKAMMQEQEYVTAITQDCERVKNDLRNCELDVSEFEVERKEWENTASKINQDMKSAHEAAQKEKRNTNNCKKELEIIRKESEAQCSNTEIDKLKSENRALNDKIKTMKENHEKDLQDLRNKKAVIEKEAETLETNIKILKSTYDKKTKGLKSSHEYKIKNYTTEIEKLKAGNTALVKDKESMEESHRKKIGKLDLENVQLKDDIGKLKYNMDIIRETFEEKKKSLKASHETSIGKLKTEIRHLEEEKKKVSKTSEMKIRELQESLDNKLNVADISRDDVGKRKDDYIASLKEEKLKLQSKLTEESKTCRTKLEEMEKLNEELKRVGPSADLVEKLQEELKQLKVDYNSVKGSHEYSKERYADLKEINTGTARSVSHWMSKYVQCNQNNTKLAKENTELKLDYEELTVLTDSEIQKNEKISKDVRILKHEKDRLAKDLNLHETMHESWKKENVRKQNTITELETKISKLEDVQSSSNGEINDLRKLRGDDKSKIDKFDSELKQCKEKLASATKNAVRTIKSESNLEIELKLYRQKSLDCGTELSFCQKKRDVLQAKVDKRDDVISEVSKNCSTLGKCEHAKTKVENNYNLALKECNCEEITKTTEDGKSEVTGFKSNIECSCQTEISNYESCSERLKQANTNIANLEKINTKLSNEKTQSNKCSNENKQLVSENKTLKDKLEKVDSKLRSTKEELEKTSCEEIQKELNTCMDAKSNCEETLKVLREKSDQCQSDITELNKQHEEMASEYEADWERLQECQKNRSHLFAHKRAIEKLLLQKDEEIKVAQMSLNHKMIQGSTDLSFYQWYFYILCGLSLILAVYIVHSTLRRNYHQPQQEEIVITKSNKSRKRDRESKKRK